MESFSIFAVSSQSIVPSSKDSFRPMYIHLQESANRPNTQSCIDGLLTFCSVATIPWLFSPSQFVEVCEPATSASRQL